MPDLKSQRRFPRIPADFAVLVTALGEHGAEAIAKTRVVGLGGCMFIHTESLEIGALVELLISVKGEVVKATARVVFERPLPEGGFETGVEFLFLTDEHRKVVQALFPEGFTPEA